VVDPWPQEAPAPPGYHAGSKPNPFLTTLGLSVFGVPYAAGWVLIGVDRAFTQQDNVDSLFWLALPVAGPFVELAYAKGSTATAVLVADGTMQGVGLGLWTIGMIWRVKIMVRDDALAIVPAPILFGGGRWGVGVQGTF
jgi:hypothetical protein